MSVENNNFYFEVGDLVQRCGTWDSFANKKIGVVMELGTSGQEEYAPADEIVKVFWQDGYGAYWTKIINLKLICKANKNEEKK